MDEDISAAVLAIFFMRQCAIQNGNLHEVLLGIIDALLNSSGSFFGFTEAVTDDAILIAYDNKCCESESTTTFGHLGDAVDANETFFELDFARLYSFYINFCHNN